MPIISWLKTNVHRRDRLFWNHYYQSIQNVYFFQLPDFHASHFRPDLRRSTKKFHVLLFFRRGSRILYSSASSRHKDLLTFVNYLVREHTILYFVNVWLHCIARTGHRVCHRIFINFKCTDIVSWMIYHWKSFPRHHCGERLILSLGLIWDALIP